MAADIQDWSQAVNVVGGSVTISGIATVTISGTPSVTVASGTISIGNTPSVTISGTPSVSISGTPTVILGAGVASIGSISAIGSTVTVAGTINIGNTPAVTISGTPTVNIGNSPTVSVSGTVNVSITSGSVSITGTPNINILSQSVTVATNQPQVAMTDLSFTGTGAPQTVTTAAVPTGTHTLLFAISTSFPLNAVTVKGHTTGIIYWPSSLNFIFGGTAPGWPNQQVIAVPISSAQDSTYDVVATTTHATTVKVTAVLDTQTVVVTGSPFSPVYIANSTKDGQLPIVTTRWDGPKTTFRVSGNFVPPAAATDVVVISMPVGGRTIRVTRLYVAMVSTTAANLFVFLLLRSTLDTAGTAVADTAISLDQSELLGFAPVVNHYTANPTLGTLVGIIGRKLLFSPVGAALPLGVEWLFGDGPAGKGIVLSTTTQQLAINFGGATVAGPNMIYEIEGTLD